MLLCHDYDIDDYDVDDRTAAINRAITWMREHLADRLRLDDLARIALFSMG